MIWTAADFKKAFAGRAPGIQGAKGRFSVLVPVVDINAEAHLLYELRSPYIDRQPSEVCFPGGEIESGETPLQAALRETGEELGISEDYIHVIAPLDLYHPPSGIVIYPFLAELDPACLSRMQLSTCEVAETFLVPVSFFQTPPYSYEHEMPMGLGPDFDYGKIGLQEPEYKWHPVKSRIISWEYEGRFIWGITAQITDRTLKILFETVNRDS